MNISNQKKLGTFVDYWTKVGRESKKFNDDIKIIVKTTYTDKNGNTRERIYKRYPTMYDVVISNKKHQSETTPKPNKEFRFSSISFSKYHDKLVNSLYGKPNRIQLQQYAKAVHDAKIEKMMLEKRLYDSEKHQNLSKLKPNLLVVKRLDSDKKPYDFNAISYNKTLEELKKDANTLVDSVKGKLSDFHSVEVWERKEYLRRFIDGKSYYAKAA